KLHGKVVDALRVFVLIRVLRMDPSLGEDIPYSPGESFKPLTWTGRRQTNDVVEDEVPLVERIVRPCELNRAAPVLLEGLGVVHFRLERGAVIVRFGAV